MLKKSFTRLLFILLWAAAPCLNGDALLFGASQQMERTTTHKLEVSSATYDKVMHELRINWKTDAPTNYKGVEVILKKMNGDTKSVRIMANPKFPTSYKFFTVSTSKPEEVIFRYLWNEDGKEVASEWKSTSALKVKDESATERFANLKPPVYTLVPVPNLDSNHDAVVKGYDQLAGSTPEAKRAFFDHVLKSVLAAAYFSTDDGGEQRVKTLHCYVDKIDMKGVYAYVTWDNNGPLVKLGYNVFSDQVNKGGVNLVDWNGVCLHEFTHLIQSMPKQGTTTETDRMTCQEGYADAIRTATGGFTDAQRLKNGKSASEQPYYKEGRNDNGLPYPYIWQAKYQTSGFFMAWLRYYDGDFLRKLSATTHLIDKGWSLEAAVKYILGENADIKALWEEYIRDVKKDLAAQAAQSK